LRGKPMAKRPVAIVVERLRKEADLYEATHNQPGPKGYNCWGWRDIAKTYRDFADTLEREFNDND